MTKCHRCDKLDQNCVCGNYSTQPGLLAKDRWDSTSVEAQFHKSIRFLTKREQGYVMSAFRDAIQKALVAVASPQLDLDGLEALAKAADGDDAWRYYTRYQEALIPSVVLALIAQARAAKPESATGTTGAIQSIDTPEFQALVENWREQPYGTRSFLTAWDALIAHIDAIIGDLRAQLAAKGQGEQRGTWQLIEDIATFNSARGARAVDEFVERAKAILSAPASAQPDRGAAATVLTDELIIEIMYPHLMDADGGYVCDRFPKLLVAGIRDVLAHAGKAASPASQPVAQSEPVALERSGPLDANELERMAKAHPDECFLKGSGVLKLLGAIRTLEQSAAAVGPSDAMGKAPSDAQIVAALHANGIDTYPSKLGFDAVQVSATSVPSLRNVLVTLAAAMGKADAANAGGLADVMQQIASIAFQRMNILRENTDPALLEIRKIAKDAMSNQALATSATDADGLPELPEPDYWHTMSGKMVSESYTDDAMRKYARTAIKALATSAADAKGKADAANAGGEEIKAMVDAGLNAIAALPAASAAMKTWPEEIYLSTGEDDELAEFGTYCEVSWCDHPTNSVDVRYVREDVAQRASTFKAAMNQSATSAADAKDAARYRVLRQNVKPANVSIIMMGIPPAGQSSAERIDMLCDGFIERQRAAIAAQQAAPASSGFPKSAVDISKLHQAIREVLKHHKLTEHGDGVVEADIAYAVIAAQQVQSRVRSSAAPLQQRVTPWMMACFGPEISADKEERNHRFFEEAAELVQAGGMPKEDAYTLVDYVYNRPVGEKGQEVGGVMITLAAWCLANGLDMHEEGETELARIWTKVEAIRAKQAAKPRGSALPVAIPPDTPATDKDGYSNG